MTEPNQILICWQQRLLPIKMGVMGRVMYVMWLLHYSPIHRRGGRGSGGSVCVYTCRSIRNHGWKLRLRRKWAGIHHHSQANAGETDLITFREHHANIAKASLYPTHHIISDVVHKVMQTSCILWYENWQKQKEENGSFSQPGKQEALGCNWAGLLWLSRANPL